MATGGTDKAEASAAADLSDRHILRQLLVHLWPKDNPEFRTRVVGALGLLVGSKLLNIQVHHTASLTCKSDPPPPSILAPTQSFSSDGVLL